VARSAPAGAEEGVDPGADAAARALRDAGFEVIYVGVTSGSGPSLDQLAEAALQEDAAAVGLPLAPDAPARADLEVELAARGLDDVLVFSTEGEASELAARIERGLGVDGDS
jgi:methylmalonyl-CoA mutase cobalamin-binding domain/chain